MKVLAERWKVVIMNVGLILLASSWADGARAQESDREATPVPLSLEVLAEDSYLIQGFQGRVRVIPEPGSPTLKVFSRRHQSETSSDLMQQHAQDWSLSLRREGHLIKIEVQAPESKELWQEIVADESRLPHFDLEIRAPVRPLDVHWRRGAIEVRSWSQPLNIYSHDAQTLVFDGQGDLNLNQQMGEIRVLQWQGPVQLSTFSGRVRLERLSGSLRVDNFSGETEILQSEGDIFLSGFEAMQKVVGGQGRIEFKHQRSPLRVENFAGDLRGESEQGEVVASLRGEVNVRVITKEAAVNLTLPGSGAAVNLGSQDGGIHSPSFLRVEQLPQLKLARGRLRGGEKGSVYVRTESGEIRLR